MSSTKPVSMGLIHKHLNIIPEYIEGLSTIEQFCICILCLQNFNDFSKRTKFRLEQFYNSPQNTIPVMPTSVI
jgi:hypothetical protein